jgi:hypothetical protein
MLSSLLNSARFARLVEQQAIDGPAALAPSEFLASVRRGIWRELEGSQVKIDAYRRNLQRAYLDLVNNKVNGQPQAVPAGLPAEYAAQFASSGDEKPFYRAELRALNASITAALAKAADRETRAHLEGARDQIAKILDPRFAPPAASSTPMMRLGFEEADPFSVTPGDRPGLCWPDYVVRP